VLLEGGLKFSVGHVARCLLPDNGSKDTGAGAWRLVERRD
jgi:hypothetical protein